jgi:hypothetical protein
MNASTALRFPNAARRKYEEQDLKRPYLTFKFRALAQNVMSSFDIRSAAMPFLRGAAGMFSESCNLAIESDMAAAYIDVVKGSFSGSPRMSPKAKNSIAKASFAVATESVFFCANMGCFLRAALNKMARVARLF